MGGETHDNMAAVSGAEMLKFNFEWYDKLRASRDSWKLVEKKVLTPHRGIAIKVKAGQTAKFILNHGPQIIDVSFLGADIKDASGEGVNNSYTIGIEGFHLKKNSRIWSNPPYFRPMATIIDDNINAESLPGEEYWPVWHGNHCTPEFLELSYGVKDHHACHSNFVEAAEAAGLDEFVARMDNVNMFQPMAMKFKKMANGNMVSSYDPGVYSPKPGEFVEWYAEIDLLLLVIHCPYGDQSAPPYESNYNPVDIEIWDTGTKPQPSPKWHDWRPAWRKKMERLKAEGDTEKRSRYFDK